MMVLKMMVLKMMVMKMILNIEDNNSIEDNIEYYMH